MWPASSVVERNVLEDELAIPVGTTQFQQDWLTDRTAARARRCEAMISVSQHETTCVQRIAFDILRRRVLQTQTHLLRALPLPVILPWCKELDALLVRTLRRILGVSELNDQQWQVVRFPAAQGGLGLHSLYDEAPVMSLSHSLSLRAQGLIHEQHKHSLIEHEEYSWAHVSRFIDIALQLKQHPQTLAEEGCMGATRVLRRAWYSLKLPSQNGGSFDPRCDTHCDDSLPAAMVGVRQRQAAATMWLLDPRGSYVSNAVLQTSISYRLGLNMHPARQPCAYVQRSTKTVCGVVKDQVGVHSNKRCHALLTSRHHGARDSLLEIAKQAGWYGNTEQIVPIRGPSGTATAEDLILQGHRDLVPDDKAALDALASSPDVRDDVRAGHKRADLVFHSPAGERVIIDVAIVHVPQGQSAPQLLQRAEQTKLAAYGVSKGQSLTARQTETDRQRQTETETDRQTVIQTDS